MKARAFLGHAKRFNASFVKRPIGEMDYLFMGLFMTLFQVLFAHIEAQQSAPCDGSLWLKDTCEIVVLLPDHCSLDPFKLVSQRRVRLKTVTN